MDFNKNEELKTIVNVTGIFGILTFVTVPITVLFYFMYSGVPPIWNVLLRVLLSIIALVFILIFYSGFRNLIIQKDIKYEWIATLLFNTVCIYVATNMVAHSLEAGSVLNQEGIAVDATQDGILAQGNYLIYGSIGRLLMAMFMIITGILTFKTRILPLWTGYFAYGIAVINIIFIPSMFFGVRTEDFYSAIGWGNSAIAASLFTYWILAVSIILLIKKTK